MAETRSKFKIMTPAKACIVLQNYIARVQRLKENKYQRQNERTYDIRNTIRDSDRLNMIASIAQFNRNDKERSILISNDAYNSSKVVTEWKENGYLDELKSQNT